MSPESYNVYVTNIINVGWVIWDFLTGEKRNF